MIDNQYLAGNFAPLEDELTAETLSVRGKIPKELDGCLARIGPNPIDPDPTTHHWFLGSGMVHGLYLRDGKALKFHSRFVRDDDVVEKWHLHTGWSNKIRKSVVNNQRNQLMFTRATPQCHNQQEYHL